MFGGLRAFLNRYYAVAMDDRRRHFRYPISLAGEIFHEQQVVTAEANNLSLGGAGFIADTPLLVGSRVTLNMFLLEDGIEDERSTSFQASAVVSWCAENRPSGFKIGTRFQSLEPAMEDQLKRFIRRLRQQA